MGQWPLRQCNASRLRRVLGYYSPANTGPLWLHCWNERDRQVLKCGGAVFRTKYLSWWSACFHWFYPIPQRLLMIEVIGSLVATISCLAIVVRENHQTGKSDAIAERQLSNLKTLLAVREELMADASEKMVDRPTVTLQCTFMVSLEGAVHSFQARWRAPRTF